MNAVLQQADDLIYVMGYPTVWSLYKLYPSPPILLPERNSQAQHVEIATLPKADFCRPVVA